MSVRLEPDWKRGRQADGLRHRESAPGALSIALVSGKGGVGKSLLAVNLSLELAAHGSLGRVLLVDGDAGLANADLLLGWVPERSLTDWIDGRATLDDVVTRGREGLDLLVSGPSPDALALLERLASGRLADANRTPFGDQRVRVFDLGAGIGCEVVGLASACDRVWLVATPEPTSLADAYAMARRLVEARPDVALELIVNRAADADEGARTHAALERMTQRFLGRRLPLRAVLPEDPRVLRAVARQEPLSTSAPQAPYTRRMRLLAESLAEEVASRAPASAERPFDHAS